MNIDFLGLIDKIIKEINNYKEARFNEKLKKLYCLINIQKNPVIEQDKKTRVLAKKKLNEFLEDF